MSRGLLAASAAEVEVDRVRDNVDERFGSPNSAGLFFEYVLGNFIDRTRGEAPPASFPSNSSCGLNLLDDDVTRVSVTADEDTGYGYRAEIEVGLVADVALEGSLRVRFQGSHRDDGLEWTLSVHDNSYLAGGEREVQWNDGPHYLYDVSERCGTIDLFWPSDSAPVFDIEFQGFENLDEQPTWTKTVTFELSS